jgi:hypothetical protein
MFCNPLHKVQLTPMIGLGITGPCGPATAIQLIQLASVGTSLLLLIRISHLSERGMLHVVACAVAVAS